MATIKEAVFAEMKALPGARKSAAVCAATVVPEIVSSDPFFEYLLWGFREHIETHSDVERAFAVCSFFAFQAGMLYERALRRKPN